MYYRAMAIKQSKTLHNVCLEEKILRLLTCNTLKIKMILDGCCHVAWKKLFWFPSPHRRETKVEISATVSRDIITSYYHILQPKKEIHIVTTWYRHLLCSVPWTEVIACLEPHLCRLGRIQRFWENVRDLEITKVLGLEIKNKQSMHIFIFWRLLCSASATSSQ